MSLKSRTGNREKYSFYNSLSILLKAIETKKTTIDLRNEAYVYGTVEAVDGFMNVVMKDCIFTDPQGDKFNFDTFFVQARNIRCVHIPPNIPIIPAINEQLGKLRNEMKKDRPKHTFKAKKTQKLLERDKKAVQNILNKKEIEKSC